MIDSETITRLMVGLISAVYLFLTYISIKDVTLPRSMVPTVAVVAIVVGIWVFAPDFLEAGAVDLPLQLRRLGLVIGGAAIVVRYTRIRRPGSGNSDRILGALGAPLLGVCLAVATANWIVGVAAMVLVGTDLVRRVGGSRAADSKQSPPPPDNQ
jgi:hypothetical protein